MRHALLLVFFTQDNGEVACHASKIVCTTAVQCINHKRKLQYTDDLKASGLEEEAEMIAFFEKEARDEKDRYPLPLFLRTLWLVHFAHAAA